MFAEITRFLMKSYPFARQIVNGYKKSRWVSRLLMHAPGPSDVCEPLQPLLWNHFAESICTINCVSSHIHPCICRADTKEPTSHFNTRLFSLFSSSSSSLLFFSFRSSICKVPPSLLTTFHQPPPPTARATCGVGKVLRKNKWIIDIIRHWRRPLLK